MSETRKRTPKNLEDIKLFLYFMIAQTYNHLFL